MRKLTSFQIKLSLIAIAVLIVGIALFLYMLKSMSTVNGDINISKIEAKDKIYTYDINSDFYFNVSRYNENGEKIAQFSQLIPTKTSLGYDFSKENPELILKNYDNSKELQLIANNDTALTNQVDVIKNFSKEYSLISAIQDEHYFKENVKKTQEIVQNLYKTKTELTFDSLDKFYENSISTVIRNLQIRTPKLNEIGKNIKSFEKCDDKEWCSTLVKWSFGENDSISLEYITKVEKIDLDEYLKDQKEDVTITKMTKISNNEVSKFFMITPNKENKREVRTYFMDDNGHVYLLRYKYHPNSLKKYQNDFIKIAYGINFIDVTNFENKYAQIHNKLNEFKEKLDEINELDKELSQFSMYEHFKLQSNLVLELEQIYGIYQNDKNYMEIIQKEYNDKYLLKEAIKGLPNSLIDIASKSIKLVYEKPILFVKDKIESKNSDSNSYIELEKDKYYASKLKELCLDLECVRNLKANNWKVEEK